METKVFHENEGSTFAKRMTKWLCGFFSVEEETIQSTETRWFWYSIKRSTFRHTIDFMRLVANMKRRLFPIFLSKWIRFLLLIEPVFVVPFYLPASFCMCVCCAIVGLIMSKHKNDVKCKVQMGFLVVSWLLSK